MENSHYYIMIEGSEDIFDVPVVDYIDIIKYDVGHGDYGRGTKWEKR